MARNKKDGTPSKISASHTLEEKKEILDKYCLMRKSNEYNQKEICEKLSITPQALYNWLKQKELKDYEKKFKEATKVGDLNDTNEVVLLAKNQLRKLLNGYTVKETTKQYKYENGEKILVTEYIKEKNVEADFDQIKWVLERLSHVYSDNSAKNVLQTFMSFNTYLQEISPELAQKISILQNNFLSQNVKDIEEIK